MQGEIRSALYQAIQRRPRPEDVADIVMSALENDLTDEQERILDQAASNSFRRLGRNFTSSMFNDFVRPKSEAAKTLAVAQKLIAPLLIPFSPKKAMDAGALGIRVAEISRIIGRGYADMKKLNHTERKALGIFKNARWYNKRWRILVRLEKKIARLEENNRLYLHSRISKSGRAVELTEEDVGVDLNTSCFIAYYSSRMSLRSTFTNGSQVRAFDKISEMLLQRCEKSETTRWEFIALVLPEQRVLTRLSDEKKGVLLGQWWSLLVAMADTLKAQHDKYSFDLAAMIVGRGNDSSTWNLTAGAWNKARDQWFSLTRAMGMSSMLDAICPGKVMRLMAADVARWHEALHPDTVIWAKLPLPWDVVQGKAECTRQMVAEVCMRTKNEARLSSWIGETEYRKAVSFTPTPELVHGVSVSSPFLASALRKAGYFSGKGVSPHAVPDVYIQRDAEGHALHVIDTNETNSVAPKRSSP
jgi:hypothetical protein